MKSRKVFNSEVSPRTYIQNIESHLGIHILFSNSKLCSAMTSKASKTREKIDSQQVNFAIKLEMQSINKFIKWQIIKKSIQKMQEGMKQSGQSFLQKFKGKTNKVSKHGIDHLMKQKLQPISKDVQYKSLESSRQAPQLNRLQKSMIKSPMTIESSKTKQAKRLAEDMQELFSQNPQFTKSRKIVLKKINHQQHSIANQKNLQQYSGQRKERVLPPLYTPQKNYKRAISSNLQSFIDSNQSHRTNSQHGSAVSQKKSKYVFGKYLKLDEDAMKHFEFLKNIEQKSLIKKNKFIER